MLADQQPTETSSSGTTAADLGPASGSGSSIHGTHPSSADAASGPSSAEQATALVGQPPLLVTHTWLDRLPQSWVPYAQLMRLDKPIGTWLLAWPCFWSICLAAPPGTLPDLRLLALFGSGAVLLRGAGCTVNDLWDRELDKQVERTRSRPLAAGTVTPLQAVAFLGLQLSAGLAILLQLNPYSQLLGASSLALVATYPLMKRITGWPQAFLGLTFNWGALLGWAAVHGSCDWGVVLPLYASGVCWTLVYDTIYAHQDKADDTKAGIRSTALTFGARTKQYCAGFGAASVGLLALTGHMAGCGGAYYAGVSSAAAHLAWQIGSVDLDSGLDCSRKFVSNTQLGALVCGGILADRLQLLPLLAG
ncbi:hypothetical protein D9Q98_007490 [Chlorella vulgaris]|uniref:4-hydroxybenzoate polyprenyltransferase, mitochondrial n=1 Tax=Chlorella vulgaris TaxID=3077 RepID=A0A9D4YVJ9_CHLVU|nr:hypothetical protein D9Q98_007490 [Chlorella vulgaris]